MGKNLIVKYMVCLIVMALSCNGCSYERTSAKPGAGAFGFQIHGETMQNPYQSCKTWTNVFQKVFTDEFTFVETMDKKQNEKLIALFFENIVSVDVFWDDMCLAVATLKTPDDAGVNVEDKLKLSTLILCLEDGAEIVIFKDKNTMFNKVTINLHVSEKNEITDLIQKKYNEEIGEIELDKN